QPPGGGPGSSLAGRQNQRFKTRFHRDKIPQLGRLRCAKPDAISRPLVGVWLSPVEHCVRDAGVAGSNPATPTILPKVDVFLKAWRTGRRTPRERLIATIFEAGPRPIWPGRAVCRGGMACRAQDEPVGWGWNETTIRLALIRPCTP